MYLTVFFHNVAFFMHILFYWPFSMVDWLSYGFMSHLTQNRSGWMHSFQLVSWPHSMLMRVTKLRTWFLTMPVSKKNLWTFRDNWHDMYYHIGGFGIDAWVYLCAMWMLSASVVALLSVFVDWSSAALRSPASENCPRDAASHWAGSGAGVGAAHVGEVTQRAVGAGSQELPGSPETHHRPETLPDEKAVDCKIYSELIIIIITIIITVVVMHADGSRGIGFSVAFVCLFVCLVFSHDISKTAAARITKLDVEMFHREFWKPIYFGVKT